MEQPGRLTVQAGVAVLEALLRPKTSSPPTLPLATATKTSTAPSGEALGSQWRAVSSRYEPEVAFVKLHTSAPAPS